MSECGPLKSLLWSSLHKGLCCISSFTRLWFLQCSKLWSIGNTYFVSSSGRLTASIYHAGLTPCLLRPFLATLVHSSASSPFSHMCKLTLKYSTWLGASQARACTLITQPWTRHCTIAMFKCGSNLLTFFFVLWSSGKKHWWCSLTITGMVSRVWLLQWRSSRCQNRHSQANGIWMMQMHLALFIKSMLAKQCGQRERTRLTTHIDCLSDCNSRQCWKQLFFESQSNLAQ